MKQVSILSIPNFFDTLTSLFGTIWWKRKRWWLTFENRTNEIGKEINAIIVILNKLLKIFSLIFLLEVCWNHFTQTTTTRRVFNETRFFWSRSTVIGPNFILTCVRALEKVPLCHYRVTASVIVYEKFRVKWDFSELFSSKTCWITRF